MTCVYFLLPCSCDRYVRSHIRLIVRALFLISVGDGLLIYILFAAAPLPPPRALGRCVKYQLSTALVCALSDEEWSYVFSHIYSLSLATRVHAYIVDGV